MATLTLRLRQGDYLIQLQLDHTILVMLANEQFTYNLTPAFAEVAEKRNHLRQTDQSKIDRTLRHTLLLFALDYLHSRTSNTEDLKTAKANGWLKSSELLADSAW